jgi:RNA polymerase sigma factor (sigma-70 family)
MNIDTLELMLQSELAPARQGSRLAYGRIVQACQNMVTAVALAITRDAQASQDIAQEAFLKAWRQLDQLRNNASFLPWLREITRNLAREWLREQQRRPLSGEAAEMAMAMAADTSPEPADRLLRTEQEAVAAEVIASLPEDSREVLLLFYREGQSSRQVAKLLGLSDDAVRMRLSRARASVRADLMQRFAEFARASAPTAAFAAVVTGALMAAVPATGAAAAIGAGKLGAGGLAAGAVSGGLAGASLAVLTATATHNFAAALAGSIAGTIAGGIGTALMWRYLARRCETGRELNEVRNFLRLHALTGSAWLLCLMLATLLTRGWVAIVGVAVAGLAVLHYQLSTVLSRTMEPMLARAADATRRREYDWLIGRSGAWLGSAIALAAIVFAVYRAGRF